MATMEYRCAWMHCISGRCLVHYDPAAGKGCDFEPSYRNQLMLTLCEDE
ncbi:hypothetical protein [[Clostridium] polysaccharolyticum]|nr:hypothetical protein [[Clostridium] polysaccharolyticum]